MYLLSFFCCCWQHHPLQTQTTFFKGTFSLYHLYLVLHCFGTWIKDGSSRLSCPLKPCLIRFHPSLICTVSASQAPFCGEVHKVPLCPFTSRCGCCTEHQLQGRVENLIDKLVQYGSNDPSYPWRGMWIDYCFNSLLISLSFQFGSIFLVFTFCLISFIMCKAVIG